MEYESKPDRRLWAVVVFAAALVPLMIGVELAVPGVQPHLPGPGGSTPPPSGGGGGTAVEVIMPNGVNIQHNLNFQPAVLKLVIGVNNTITWTNDDSADHTVSFVSGPSGVSLASISDPDVGSGQTFTITLSTAGTYQYHCAFHPGWMKGTITVVAG